MSASTPIRIVGAPGSPYSRKMRAVLRYRRIPFRWIIRGSKDDRDIPDVPVALIPVLVFPEGDAMVDSTYQIERLEKSITGRSLGHPDPALAFIDALIEDYADEWLTKAMFHYRWAYPADIQKAAEILPRWGKIDGPEEMVQQLGKVFAKRQIDRLGVVGSNKTTGPVIEQSYRGLLRALDSVLRDQPFVMGRRPGASDFGLLGQLTQLALFDPTPMAVALEESPRVVTWCDLIEDLSGFEVEEGDWMSRDAVPESVTLLLRQVGTYYAPFLLGNADALERGADGVECEIAGHPWTQKPFPYQGKCLGWLRERHRALSDADRHAADTLLEGTGCEALF
ncbi:MAG: glutathione S-transferase [Deltaproteobacteria bacterium]|nr:glutathione S-transferase [Deltaproteobacteria bacterium]MBW2382564.1 glutathione S-transferase [Deltaproteobacteria bacterium]MBW2697225.1 glutathione S-transferase [Deltaproteobacteria bacterium]